MVFPVEGTQAASCHGPRGATALPEPPAADFKATIEGDRVFVSSQELPSQKQITIRKHGHFGSRACDAHEGPDEPNFTSARFGRNLFVNDGASVETLEWTKIQTGVASNIHTQTPFTNFAAQGLYGKYDLFLEAGDLSDDGGDGICLRCLDDIKLSITVLHKTQN